MCGISLVLKTSRVNDQNPAAICYHYLQGLQHRGQQGAKMYYGTRFSQNPSSTLNFTYVGGLGCVDKAINIKKLDAFDFGNDWAIGHTRYSTSGQKNSQDLLQPFQFTLENRYNIIFAHNGQLGGSPTKLTQCKKQLEKLSYQFTTDSDTELFYAELSVNTNQKNNIHTRIQTAINNVHGSASLAGIVIDKLKTSVSAFACRKNGNRPLFSIVSNDHWIVTSEDYMFRDEIMADHTGVESSIYEIKSGEYISYTSDEKSNNWERESVQISPETNPKRYCIFELFYFSHPLSTFLGVTISQIRKEFGRALYKEHAEKLRGLMNPIVLGVPDSGNQAALGFSEKSKYPFELGIIRNHYSGGEGRSFICDSTESRVAKARHKYTIDSSVIKGKSVIVVDDSMVRSITATVLASKLRYHGATEIYFLLASPKVVHPNYYGIDIRTKEELPAALFTESEMAKNIGVDYLGYLSLNNSLNVVTKMTKQTFSEIDFCTICFGGPEW